MGPACSTDCGPITAICNPNALPDADFLVQGYLPCQCDLSWLFGEFSTILTRSRPLKHRLLEVRFPSNPCCMPKIHFGENSCFASMKTQFHGFGKLRNHDKLIQNSMQNGRRQKQHERHRKPSFGMVNLCSKACAGHQNLIQNASKSPDLPNIGAFSVLWWRLGPSDS